MKRESLPGEYQKSTTAKPKAEISCGKWGDGGGEGMEKYRSVVTKHSWDCKYSIGNKASNIAISTHAARWVLEI